MEDGFSELLGLLTLAFGECGVPLIGVLDVGVWGSFELSVIPINCSLDSPKEVQVIETFAILVDCPTKKCLTRDTFSCFSFFNVQHGSMGALSHGKVGATQSCFVHSLTWL
jgi:hypothetical protein